MSDSLEESMKPGGLSMGGFLGEYEKLDEVLSADDETIKKLSLTHEQIASRLEYFSRSPPYSGKIERRRCHASVSRMRLGVVGKGPAVTADKSGVFAETNVQDRLAHSGK